jgi:hypothetical protein
MADDELDDDFDPDAIEEDLDEEALDPDELDDELDDETIGDEDGGEALGEADEDEEEEADVVEETARAKKRREEDDDEDDVDPDDVEADLDTILKDRIAAADDDDEDEELEEQPRNAPEAPDGVVPKRANEFMCTGCFLLVNRGQFGPEDDMQCPVGESECPAIEELRRPVKATRTAKPKPARAGRKR